MSGRRGGHWLAAVLAIIAALVLSVVPLPDAVAAFRPDWIALLFLYWCFVDPRRYVLITAFAAGLALDSLAGTLLGQHSLALVLIVFLSQRFYLRIRTFPASQILLTVVILLGLYEFILYWVDGVAGRETPLIERWGPALTGSALWLFVLAGIERGRQEAAARM